MERLSSVSRVQNYVVAVRENAAICGSNVRYDNMIQTLSGIS